MLSIPVFISDPSSTVWYCTMTQDLQTSVCLFVPRPQGHPHFLSLSEGQVIAFLFGFLCPVLFLCREPRVVVVT